MPLPLSAAQTALARASPSARLAVGEPTESGSLMHVTVLTLPRRSPSDLTSLVPDLAIVALPKANRPFSGTISCVRGTSLAFAVDLSFGPWNGARLDLEDDRDAGQLLTDEAAAGGVEPISTARRLAFALVCRP